MAITNTLYKKLPISVQNLAISAYGYAWKKRRFGGVFETELIGFKNRENFTYQQWSDYENQNLQRLLVHAFDTVPFYKETFSKAGFQRSQLERFSTSDLVKLPLLQKDDLRKFGKSTLLSSIQEKGGKFFASSGSTGTPTQILFSHPMHQRWSAGFEARIRHWAGVDRNSSRGMIGGRRVVPKGDATPPFYRYNFFEKQVYFSAYHIAALNAVDYLNGIKKYNVEYMTGYAMSNFFLARFLQEMKLEVPQLKAVITSSEKLTPEMRKTFADVYHCKSFDSWSGLEACGLVSECEHGTLHLSPDLGVVEILDDNGYPVKPGEIGEVICTGLINFDQPLIRYRIGDMMRLGQQSCPCGRNMPVISEIVGRVEDTVIGTDGREMVRFHGIFVDLPNLIEGQIIQWDLDQYEIKIVNTGKWTEEETIVIKKRMVSQLGEVKIDINCVDSIPRNANGKFKAVISHIKRNTIETSRG